MDEKIRCAFFFHDTDYYSGGSRSLIDIINGYIGKEVIQITAVFPSKEGSAIEHLRKKNIECICSHYYQIRYDLTESGFSFLKRLPKRIMRMLFGYIYIIFFTVPELKKRNINVIYSNTSFILGGLWAAKALHVPILAHFREFGEEDHHIGVWIGRKIFYWLAKDYDRIICISKALKEKYSIHINQEKISVIYDDVSPEYINWDKSNDTIEKLNILLAGNLIPGKGQFTAIKKLSELLKKNENIDVYIAGNTSDILYVEAMKKYIYENELTKRIHFLGLVKDMNSLRSKMHIGIVLSEMEAFGRVTIEGMLSGLVMIVSNTGGSAELIENGKTGFLVSADGDGLETIIQEIFLNYKAFFKMRNCAFSYACTFTEGNCANKIIELLKEMRI